MLRQASQGSAFVANLDMASSLLFDSQKCFSLRSVQAPAPRGHPREQWAPPWDIPPGLTRSQPQQGHKAPQSWGMVTGRKSHEDRHSIPYCWPSLCPSGCSWQGTKSFPVSRQPGRHMHPTLSRALPHARLLQMHARQPVPCPPRACEGTPPHCSGLRCVPESSWQASAQMKAL
jgi:hypothetical protein